MRWGREYTRCHCFYSMQSHRQAFQSHQSPAPSHSIMHNIHNNTNTTNTHLNIYSPRKKTPWKAIVVKLNAPKVTRWWWMRGPSKNWLTEDSKCKLCQNEEALWHGKDNSKRILGTILIEWRKILEKHKWIQLPHYNTQMGRRIKTTAEPQNDFLSWWVGQKLRDCLSCGALPN